MPVIMPENKEALEIYSMVCTQMIVSGFGDPIGIDFKAVKIVLDLYEVENQSECFKKVVTIASHIIKASQEKRSVDAKIK